MYSGKGIVNGIIKGIVKVSDSISEKQIPGNKNPEAGFLKKAW